MYVAHSNIAQPDNRPIKKREASSYIERMEHRLWTKAIKKALAKYANEIAEIQKHFPGWQPTFRK